MACSTVLQTQGPRGKAGANGANGTDGVSAFTTLTAAFTMPAELANATATVVDSSMFASGQTIYLQGAGFLEVQSIVNATQLTLKNLKDTATYAYLDNVAPATVIAIGSTLVSAGIQGPGATTQYALIEHQEADGVDGGDFNTGSTQTVPLTIEVTDTGSFVTLAANQPTLLAGTYRAVWRVLGYKVAGFQSWLYNSTDAVVIQLGSVSKSAAADDSVAWSHGSAYFTLAATKTLELQAACNATEATDGFGPAASLGVGEVYSSIEFFKVI